MPLPREIIISRLRNELTLCSKYLKMPLDTSDEKLNTFPAEFELTLLNTPGPVMEEGKVVHRYSHKFKIILSSEYPFEKPLVVWMTPIFHPNVMMPEDGGHVCTKLLSDWGFNSTLLSFVKGIEALLVAPNGESPFGTATCTQAAEFFNSGRKTMPIVMRTLPKVVRK